MMPIKDPTYTTVKFDNGVIVKIYREQWRFVEKWDFSKATAPMVLDQKVKDKIREAIEFEEELRYDHAEARRRDSVHE